MNEAQRSERRVDRLVGRRQLLNWRWWVALLPVIIVLVTLHAIATLTDGLSDALEWLAHQCWWLCFHSRRAAHWITTTCRGWVFKLPASPNYK